MVHRHTQDRQTYGNVHPHIEAMQFDRYVSLIMVHCDNEVKRALCGAREYCVRGMWAGGVNPFLPGQFHGRRDLFQIFRSKQAVLTCMGI